MHWNQFCYHIFFKFEKVGVKPGFPFTQLNQATYSELGNLNFDVFLQKIIAEQSSVIQYAWPMCHMKEE